MYTYQTFQQESLPPAVLVHTNPDLDPVAAYIAPRVEKHRPAANTVMVVLYAILAVFTLTTTPHFFMTLGLLILLGFSFSTLMGYINTKPTNPIDRQRAINAIQKMYPSVRIIDSEKNLFKEFPPYVNS